MAIILALNKVKQTKQRINVSPVSLHGENSTVHINKLASGGSLHKAGGDSGDQNIQSQQWSLG